MPLLNGLVRRRAAKLLNELAMTGQIKNVPKKLQNSLVFSEIDLVWDEDDEMFVSKGIWDSSQWEKALFFRSCLVKLN